MPISKIYTDKEPNIYWRVKVSGTIWFSLFSTIKPRMEGDTEYQRRGFDSHPRANVSFWSFVLFFTEIILFFSIIFVFMSNNLKKKYNNWKELIWRHYMKYIRINTISKHSLKKLFRQAVFTVFFMKIFHNVCVTYCGR